MRQYTDRGADIELHLPSNGSRHCQAAPSVRNVHEIDAGHGFQQLHRHVRAARQPRRRVIDRAGLCLGQCQQVLQRLRGETRMRRQQIRKTRQLRNRRKIAPGVVGHALVHARIHRNAGGYHQQRMPVGCGTRHQFGTDDGARARPVIHHHWLLPRFRQCPRNQPCGEVRGSARRLRHYNAQRTRWITGGWGAIALCKRWRTGEHKQA